MSEKVALTGLVDSRQSKQEVESLDSLSSKNINKLELEPKASTSPIFIDDF